MRRGLVLGLGLGLGLGLILYSLFFLCSHWVSGPCGRFEGQRAGGGGWGGDVWEGGGAGGSGLGFKV